VLRTALMDSDKRSAQVERLEVVDTGRRRRWSEDEKLKIVLESLRTPRQISATARRYGVSRSLLIPVATSVSGRASRCCRATDRLRASDGGPGTRGDALASRLDQWRGDRDRVCGRGSIGEVSNDSLTSVWKIHATCRFFTLSRLICFAG